jgi:poly-gamma-glutamate biosynthesis protein PgsC/CapC
MHDYFYHSEIVRLALVVSVIVSMLFYERLQLTSGGAIVPAYLALFLPAPLQVVTTVALSYMTYLLVSVVLAKWRILYGRRKFEVEVLVGLALLSTVSVVSGVLGAADPTLVGLSGIGFVVPGVLAHDMFRQGPMRTVLALTATIAIVAVAVFVCVSLLAIAPVIVAPVASAELIGAQSAYPNGLLLPAVIIGVLVGIWLFARLGLRSGGFVTGAYLALVLNRPLDIAFALGAALITYVIVRHILMRRLLVFGRRKLSAMILVGAIVAWTAEVAIAALTHDAYHPWLGFTVVTLIVPALIANDMERQGVERTLWGVAIVTMSVFGAVSVLAGVVRA